MLKNSINCLDEILKSLKDRRLVAFCGAGVSVNSGLPQVSGLVDAILERLPIPPDARRIVLDSSLPFEAFIEALSGNTNIDPLLAVFSRGQPNSTHLLLAKLARSGFIRTICTTNFDRHIESSLEAEGMSLGEDYLVFATNLQFRDINWTDEKVRIIKLHGTIEDLESVSITLRMVASRILLRDRQEVVAQIFARGQHTHVLVLGYSCSDSFDLSPAIAAQSCDHKTVIYVQHLSSVLSDPLYGMVEDLAKRKIKNPFTAYRGSARWYFDTDQLVKAIWSTTLDDPYILTSDNECERPQWQTCVEDWWRETIQVGTQVTGYLVSAHLLVKSGHPRRATRLLNIALDIARSNGDRESEGIVLANLGLCHDSLDEYQVALEFNNQALAIVRELGDRYGESNSLGQVGMTHCKLGEYEKAKHLFTEALKISQEVEDLELSARLLANLGSTLVLLGDYQKAINANTRALQIALDIGDVEGQGNNYIELGNVMFRISDYKASIYHYNQALRIAKDIGNSFDAGRALGNLGAVEVRLGNYPLAVHYLKECVGLAQASENKQLEAMAMGNLGAIYKEIELYGLASDCLRSALEIDDLINDQPGKALHLSILAEVFFGAGWQERALEHHIESLNIYRGIGDLQGVGTELGSVGGVYRAMGQPKDAVPYLEDAMLIARRIGDRVGEGIRLANLAGSYLSLGEYERAVTCGEESIRILELLPPPPQANLEAIRAIIHQAKRDKGV
jgi:FOG: TPR repeat